MTQKQALDKLKSYWISSGGDLLRSMKSLRKDLEKQGRKVPEKLTKEISVLQAVYEKFDKWKLSSYAKTKRRDAEAEVSS